MGPTDKQMATVALQFLARTDFKGSEVEHFVAVRNWLTAMTETEETLPREAT